MNADRLEQLKRVWHALDEEPDVAMPWMGFAEKPEAGEKSEATQRVPTMPLVYLDVETTGLDTRENGVCGIAAFAVSDPRNWFACRTKIGPEEFCDMEALAVNGESMGRVMHTNPDRLDACHALGLLREWIDRVFPMHRHVMVTGWNCQFDLAFCRPRWGGVQPRPRVSVASRVMDWHSIMAAESRVFSLTSDRASDFLGVPRERKPHGVGSSMAWAVEMARAILGEPGQTGGPGDE